jgi:hypothetical protein
MEIMMKATKLLVFASALLFAVAASAQEFPRVDVGIDYSYARYAPSAPYSRGHSLNGGGGSATFNITHNFGIKMDLQGYGSTETGFSIPPTPSFPNGLSGRVEGNLFTYMFGPEYKVRAHMMHPFVHALFGGAHSNVYSNAYQNLCVNPLQAARCSVSTRPSNDAFAMALGGGVDIPVGKHFSIRPAELDYLLTHFSNPFTGGKDQHNFRYSCGVVFSFGHTSY